MHANFGRSPSFTLLVPILDFQLFIMELSSFNRYLFHLSFSGYFRGNLQGDCWTRVTNCVGK